MVKREHAAAGKTGPMTVKDAIESYLAAKEADHRDVVDSRCRAEAHVYPVLGDMNCADLATEHIRKWHRGLIKAAPRTRTKAGQPQRFRKFTGDKEAIRRRQASANRVLTILKAALNAAFRDGKIPSDSAWRKVERFRGVDAARLRYLTVEESKRLINACDPDFRPIVQAALQTGARYGQLAQLRVSDFNPDAGTLRLGSRKGDGTEKTYHATLTDEGTSFFRHVVAGRSGDELIFRNAGRIGRATARLKRLGKVTSKAAVDDAGDWRGSEQDRPMHEACARAKLSPAIGFHGLRHTWASNAAMNGVPLLVVAKNLGHSDTRMVEKHYGHLAPSYVADAIRAGAPKFGFRPDRKVTPIAGR
jgi:integrase